MNAPEWNGSRVGSSSPPRSMTICGSGNGAHALAVVASQNLDGDIDWLIGSEEKADRIRHAVSSSGLRSTGAIAARAVRLRTISADPAEVIPHADLVVMVVPAFAHTAVIDRIRPFVSQKTTIACIPTRGGFEFEAAQLTPSHRSVRSNILGLQTLPWSTRVVTFGEVVHIGAVKSEVVLATLPVTREAAAAALVSKLLGIEVIATQSFLSLTLGNPGQFIHPGLMYGHFRSWGERECDEDEIPLLYAHATDEIGDIVAGLSRDAINVAMEIEAQSHGVLTLQGGVAPIHDWLRRTYGSVTGDMRSVAACFRTGPIQARKAPMIEVGPGRFVPNYEYRYLSEDVPFGLVVTRAFAEMVDVETPVIDEVISWAQTVLDKVYLGDGKVAGPDAAGLPLPQNYGVRTVPDLVDWYREASYSRA